MSEYHVCYEAGGFGQLLATFDELDDAKAFTHLWIKGHPHQLWNSTDSFDLTQTEENSLSMDREERKFINWRKGNFFHWREVIGLGLLKI